MGLSPSTEALREKTVVVIGGSYGGKQIADSLRGCCKLIVIDTRESMHLTIAAPRAVVEPGFVKKTLIPMKEFYKDSFKRGTVQSIDPDEKAVTLTDGEKIPYDYLVIASGSSAPFPGKIDNDMSTEKAIELYQGICEKVKAAEKIVIIGGGAVGVELAGEIATDHPGKDVTIIHARDSLLEPVLSEKLRANALAFLQAMDVKVLFGEKVTNLEEMPKDASSPATVKTDQGKELQADVVFVCIGMKVNSQAYTSSLAGSMDERGALKVNSYLQVEGHENIFAVGDCCNADMQKMALRAGEQAKAAAKNIILHAGGSQMKPYKPPTVLFLVSVGRNKGQLQMGPVTTGVGFIVSMKIKDLFTSRTWKEWGMEVPE
ncbi:ferroptosis suppressor protein 1-like [Diadema setosum]|uniref:ferroptosis suppressor protein 1-like n=1 Tax=Diadema setosum TaxID=31175 RepID=UPI003B3ABAF2